MVPAGHKTKRFLLVSHTTKTVHHHVHNTFDQTRCSKHFELFPIKQIIVKNKNRQTYKSINTCFKKFEKDSHLTNPKILNETVKKQGFFVLRSFITTSHQDVLVNLTAISLRKRNAFPWKTWKNKRDTFVTQN